MKPGFLTSEFWLVILAGILTNLGAIDVPERYRWIVNLGLVAGYAISRGLAKYETTPTPVLGNDAAELAELEQAEQNRITAEQLAAQGQRSR